MAAELLHSVLLSLCVGIGHVENGEFLPGEECLSSLKDLKRLLKQDIYSSDRAAFIHLGDWNVFEKHLVPMLFAKSEPEYTQLFGMRGSWIAES